MTSPYRLPSFQEEDDSGDLSGESEDDLLSRSTRITKQIAYFQRGLDKAGTDAEALVYTNILTFLFTARSTVLAALYHQREMALISSLVPVRGIAI